MPASKKQNKRAETEVRVASARTFRLCGELILAFTNKQAVDNAEYAKNMVGFLRILFLITVFTRLLTSYLFTYILTYLPICCFLFANLPSFTVKK